MYPIAKNEALRLATLRRLGIERTSSEPHFDAVCRLARRLFSVPIALISFVEEDRQWFKAKCGLDVEGTAREVAFCNYTILTDKVFVVDDATVDHRFSSNPLVTGPPGIRFYAGAPLVLAPGLRIGTICIIDTVPRTISLVQRLCLHDLAEAIIAPLRVHESAINQKQALVALQDRQRVIETQAEEIRQRDMALGRSNRHLRLAEQIAQTGHMRLELPEMRRVWSNEVYRIFGLDPQSEPPELAADVNGYHPDDQERVRRKLSDAIASGSDVCYEARVLRPSGEVRHVVVRGTHEPEDGEGGRAFVGAVIDVTDIIQARAQLKESEGQFRLLVEGVSDYAIYMLDPDGKVTNWNRGAERIKGYSAGEVVGSNFSRFYSHQDRIAAAPQKALSTAAATGHFEGEGWRVRKDGERFWANVVIQAIREKDGKLLGFAKITRDVTERRTVELALQESELRYRTLADALPQIVWVMNAQDGEASYTNRQFSTYYGAIGTRAAARLARNHPDDTGRLDLAWQAVREGRSIETEVRLQRHDGVYRWHKLVMIPVSRDGAIVEWIGTALDIDDIIAARAKVEETAELLRATLENMDQGLVLYGSDMRVRVHNRRARELLDLPRDVLFEGSRHSAINDYQTARGDLLTRQYSFSKTLDEGELCNLPDVYEHLRPNGESLEVRVVRLADGGSLRTYTDITRRKEADQKITYMALHDALTGLPNRMLFRDRLDQQLVDMKQHGSRFAVLACDLDRFKAINDTFGHPAGDNLLRTIADRLRSVLRDGDTVARLGGDEFAIILNRLDSPQTASHIAHRVIDVVGQSVDLDGDAALVGVSIGIALGSIEYRDADTLFKDADIALYRAKAAGRNTFSFYEPGMDAVVAKRNLLERDLHEAVRNGDFVLYYQPIINLAGDAIGGFEALLRWQHPQRGMVSPGEFIPLTEETGLIVSIGAWALREACREAADWPGDLHVAVNVSAVQFKKPGFEEIVIGALATSGLAPQRLELEVTESVLIEDSERTIACLHRLRGLGVRISLDDFGTGYSSLSYLRRFPFDKIKIDRSFVSDICNPDTAAIVRAIVGIGEQLGTTVLAEGVETDRQLERIRQERCTEVQGFLYSKPLPAADALNFVEERLNRSAA